jgi:glucans biosynthesis protein C
MITAPRLAFVDNLRSVLILLVIAHHAVEPYASKDARWTILPDPAVPGLWSFLWVNAAFFMGALFLLAGIFTPASFDRKGSVAFLRDRSIRLGVPLIFGFLVLIPLQAWFHHRVYRAMPPIGYGDYFTNYFLGLAPKPAGWPGRTWPDRELGHLWFLQHLWIYAGLYALWRTFIPAKPKAAAEKIPPGNFAIAVYAVLLAAGTWAIRQRYPQDTWIDFLGFVQVEPAHILQYASLFLIGIYAGPRLWLQNLPTRRGLAWLALGLGLAVLCYVMAGTGLIRRFDSQSWFACAWESALCTSLCVGLPVAFREFANRTGPILKMLAANSYAAYVFHFPFVMMIQWLLIGSGLPIAVRIAITLTGVIAVTFAFTSLIVLRLPGAGRIF